MDKVNYHKIKNMFMSQSYQDAWDDYVRSLQKSHFIRWDYVILTASNEAQAAAFRIQIDYRLKQKSLPEETKYVVLPDPDGQRVGSGGATFHVLKYLAEQCPGEPFSGKRILVIHSGGDSKRVPQYSAVGKLFSPTPRVLPDGRASTLFDEFIIGMSGVAGRIQEGMLVLSGDVLLLFNPLQIDAQFDGAAAISIKEPVFTGKNHGVFLNDGMGNVKRFLHKQSEETLRSMGAVNDQDAVDLDTGAILLSVPLLKALFGLISTDGKNDSVKFDSFVNTMARVSFYGDFLFPLATDATLEQYYLEKPEGEFTEELKACRTKLWEVLSPFSLKLLCLSPARFIHFGTTRELRHLMTQDISDYEFLDWSNRVMSNAIPGENQAFYNAYIEPGVILSEDTYIEDSELRGNTLIGRGSIVSNLCLTDVAVPSDVVIHGLPLNNEKFVVRIYGVNVNPKEGLWDENCYPVCDSMEEALSESLKMYEDREAYFARAEERTMTSLRASYNAANLQAILDWQAGLRCRILCNVFEESLISGKYYLDALKTFGRSGITEEIYRQLMQDAKDSDFSKKIRIYYSVSKYMKDYGCTFMGCSYDSVEELCFGAIRDAVRAQAEEHLPKASDFAISENEVHVNLPVRVNWGGGWTDTPPYCNENGGVVVNAALSLNGILPIQICVKKIDELCVQFESQDIGVFGTIHTVEEILNCCNPYDSFALHKAALIACGLIPLDCKETLEEVLARIGGGIYLSTQVVGIPKGSGLGTSSILAGACVKGLFRFLGLSKTDKEIYEAVLCMEQIMSTGGGWQDQVGGLTGGIKMIMTDPGMEQNIEVTPIIVPESAMKELSERFALIYTGQRRLARNLLRDVIGNYVGARPESVEALKEMKNVAKKMKFYLESGDIDSFAMLMNEHWELSKQLDAGSTNHCIDQIFMSCEDLIDARFIAGAGGGGFIMVILRKGVEKQRLGERLSAIFQDSGVTVWESSFV